MSQVVSKKSKTKTGNIFFNRKHIFKIHSILGVVAGILLLLLSVSGSIISFRHELETRMYPQLEVAPYHQPIDYTKVQERISQEYPDYLPTRVSLPTASTDAVRIQLIGANNPNDRREVAFNPHTKEVEALPKDWLHYTIELHYFLLLPRYAGIWVTFILSVCLLVLVGTGFYIYQNKIKDFVLFRHRLKFKSWKNLHSSIGIISLFFNALMGATALILTFAGVLNGPREASFFKQEFDKNLPVTELIHLANQQVVEENPRLKSFTYLQGQTMFHYDLVPEHEGALVEYKRIFLNPQTGELVKTDGKTDGAIVRGLNSSLSFHVGDFGGIGVRILYAVLGMGLSLLTISGSVVHFKRSKKVEFKPIPLQILRFTFGDFRRNFRNGVKYSLIIILVSFAGGVLWGSMMGNMLNGGVYLTIIFTFLMVLNFIFLLIFWLFFLIWCLFQRKPVIFLPYTSASFAMFLVGFGFLLLTHFIG